MRVLLVVTSLMFAAGHAQTPQSRVSTVPRSGTGLISGVVLSDESDRRPLRRAHVVIDSGLFELPDGALTDDAGQFVFAGLAAGNYTLSAKKAGYVSAPYGATRPGDRIGQAIAIRDGQRVTGLTIRMSRGGVITGTVRQPNGQPAAGTTISVTRTRGGVVSLIEAANLGAAVTDDRGVYRIFGLAPGDYVVQARVQPMFTAMANTGRRITPEEIAWAERATGVPAVPQTAAPPMTEDAMQPVAYTTVFYPGTTEAAAAAIVNVGVGQERQGVDFALQYVPMSRLSGTIVGPDGRPAARLDVSLNAAGEDETNPLTRLMFRYPVRTQPDGTFVADNVAPGRYVLSVRGAAETPPPQNPSAVMGRGLLGLLGAGSASLTLWAREELDVRGRDLTNLQVQLQPGMIVRGRVVLDASAGPGFDITTASVTLSPVVTSPMGGGNAQEAAAMAILGAMTGAGASPSADGTFEVKGVVPGRYRIGALAPGLLPGVAVTPTWMVVGVTVSGRDVADLPVEIRPNEGLRDVVVTVSDRVSELSGTVYDEIGRPTPAFAIVVFPTDRRYWLPGSSRIRQARPSSDGSFKFVALPPGQYYVCAPTDLEPNDLSDPLYLEQLTAGSFTLTIAPGEKKKQDLKLAGKSADR